MGEWLHTYYANDWGSSEAARVARNRERKSLAYSPWVGPGNVCRGRVMHPVMGEGFEVWYKAGADHEVSDLRVLPAWNPQTNWWTVIPQGPPTLQETEEQWTQAAPFWLVN